MLFCMSHAVFVRPGVQIRVQIAEVEMEERVENKPMRERILAQAEEVWGPDHATRTPPRSF